MMRRTHNRLMAQQRASFTQAEDKLRAKVEKAEEERDIALERVERVLDVLAESRGTTVSVRKIERAIG